MWPFKPKYDFKWLRNKLPLHQTPDYTPDHLWLERHEWCLLFVYDEMQLNRRKYDLIREDSVNLGKAFTCPNWNMFKKKLGDETFPIALYDMNLAPKCRIKGELHAIRPHLFWEVLDKKYFNGIEFRRERVKLIRPYHLQEKGVTIDHNEFIAETRAHMYVGINEYWLDQIDAGYLYSPVKTFSPKVKLADGHILGDYYCYSRLEDATNY